MSPARRHHDSRSLARAVRPVLHDARGRHGRARDQDRASRIAATTRARGDRRFSSGESAYYLSINRNKESVAIDFKTADGPRACSTRSIARADVLVENFRPGTLDRIGLGYAELSARHPRLIYVSISGFGQNGPRRDEAGYDAVAQAEGGLMSITGTADGPPVRLGVAIADIAAGMFAFQGLLLALIARGEHRTRPARRRRACSTRSTALLTYQAQPLLRDRRGARRGPAIAT